MSNLDALTARLREAHGAGAVEARSALQAAFSEPVINYRSRLPRIAGPALSEGTSNLYVRANLHVEEVSSLGSFAEVKRPFQVAALVSAWDRPAGDERARRARIPREEEDAWGQLLLGEYLGDFSYRVNIVRGALMPWFQPYVVFVDTALRPMLAPSDYDWNKAWGFSSPEKLAPSGANSKLTQQLLKTGPYLQAEGVEPSMRAMPEWSMLFLSGFVDRLTRVAGIDSRELSINLAADSTLTLSARITPVRTVSGSEPLNLNTRINLGARYYAAEGRDPVMEGAKFATRIVDRA